MAGNSAPQPSLEELLQTLATNVRLLRMESGLSTRAMARECHLARWTMQRIEDCQFPGVSLRTIEALARGLGVRASSLLGPNPILRKPAPSWEADALPNNLLRLRERKQLTQEALAATSGVHRSVIAAIELGTRNPSLSTLHKLADALGTSVVRLLAVAKVQKK